MFYVGQKVERLRDLGEAATRSMEIGASMGGVYPQPGVVYTVCEIWTSPKGSEILRLAEINNAHFLAKGWNREPGFEARYFRPVVERKTDISIFTDMLVPAEQVPA